MSSLNDSLEKITIIDVLLIILILMGILIIISVWVHPISQDWLYVGVILYLIYRLRFFKEEFMSDFKNLFSKISPKSLLLIVFVNVFFSYGMLYLSIFTLNLFPWINNFIYSSTIPFMAINSLGTVGSILSTVIVSPVCEELLFRGVFLNRLKLIVPITFAIAITSILFGALHSYGNIISAIVFGVCMCVIYLKTQNILTCILAHVLNNAFAEIIYYVDYNNLIFTNQIFIVIFSVLAIISLYLIIVSLNNEWKYLN